MTLDRQGGGVRWPRAAAALCGLAALVLVLVGYAPLVPPSPVPATAPADRFSAERAMAHVRVVAREPHPVGTPANAAVRAYLVRELERLGIEVELQATAVPDYYGDGGPDLAVNVVARVPGTASTRAVALVGHYDTVPATAGGNDDSTAVAALLETGRALLAGRALRNDVYLVFTDGEEPAPRFGSTAFMEGHPAVADLGVVVNFEASGAGGASIVVETSGPERWLIDELAAADPHPAAFSFLTATTRRLGDLGTDFDGFRKAGIPGLHFVYLHDSPVYHTAADDLEAVSAGSLQHHGSHALAVARRFGDLDLGDPRPVERAVFFPVGPLLVRYPAAWAVLFALLATALCLVGARRRRTAASSRSAWLGSLLGTLGRGLLATLAGSLVWVLVVAVRPTPSVVESYVGFSCALAGALLVAAWTPRRRVDEDRRAVVWIGVALSLLTAVWLPGFSYLFVWPVLAVAVTLPWRDRGGPWGQTLRTLVVAAPTLVLMTPAVDVFFQLSQPRPGNPDSEMTAVVAVPLMLVLLSLGLLRTAWPRRIAPDPR